MRACIPVFFLPIAVTHFSDTEKLGVLSLLLLPWLLSLRPYCPIHLKERRRRDRMGVL
jgi:hypothetical protein